MGMQESAGECRRVQASTGNCENHLFIGQGESRHISSKERGGGGGRWCAGAKQTTATIGGEMTAGRERGREQEGEGEGSGKGTRVQRAAARVQMAAARVQMVAARAQMAAAARVQMVAARAQMAAAARVQSSSRQQAGGGRGRGGEGVEGKCKEDRSQREGEGSCTEGRSDGTRGGGDGSAESSAGSG